MNKLISLVVIILALSCSRTYAWKNCSWVNDIKTIKELKEQGYEFAGFDACGAKCWSGKGGTSWGKNLSPQGSGCMCK